MFLQLKNNIKRPSEAGTGDTHKRSLSSVHSVVIKYIWIVFLLWRFKDPGLEESRYHIFKAFLGVEANGKSKFAGPFRPMPLRSWR